MARKTYVIPSGFGLLHILIYDLPICFDTVSEKTNRQHDAFGIELHKVSESIPAGSMLQNREQVERREDASPQIRPQKRQNHQTQFSTKTRAAGHVQKKYIR